MTNPEIITKLNLFKNKGCVIYCQQKATKVLAELKIALSEKDYQALRLAHSHYLLGEGSQELWVVCNNLILKYE